MIQIFIGGIRPLPESGRPTGMYKHPVLGQIQLGYEGFEGDRQADRRVHGGVDKAVHLYPARHYAKLAAKFPDAAPLLVPGSLGENLSTWDLDEHDVRVGDVWQLGNAQLQVCQPRNPCWKIDERFASDGMAIYIDQFMLTGWYWRVLQTGSLSANDSLERVHRSSCPFTLQQAMQLWREHRPDLYQLEQLAHTPGIAQGWQDKILRRIQYLKTAAES